MTCRSEPLLWAMALILLAGSPSASAASAASVAEPASEEDSPASESELAGNEASAAGNAVLFEELLVIGSGEAVRRVPGSAHFITREDLERQEYGDVHRILRQVPGVNIQEEDGYGLRPNIGIRGTGVEGAPLPRPRSARA